MLSIARYFFHDTFAPVNITLAPMEGVADYLTRQLITGTGGYDLCVTEFIRVSDTVYPSHVFYRLCPELRHGSQTLGGTPVHVQLLGNHGTLMAENASKAVELGAKGIDLNFGCPAKTVNRHKGGAALLLEPETIYHLVETIRAQVPNHIPVTAKMRLGYFDDSQALEIALGIEAAGANGLTIHARTRSEGYRPPAHWHKLAMIREQLAIPLTANGEIWNVADYHACRAASGCDDVMLGRGAVCQPWLGQAIKASLRGEPENTANDWHNNLAILKAFAQTVHELTDEDAVHYNISNRQRYLGDRIKQWLSMMSKRNQDAALLFDSVKRCKSVDIILSELQAA